jgi:hypothetical protein
MYSYIKEKHSTRPIRIQDKEEDTGNSQPHQTTKKKYQKEEKAYEIFIFFFDPLHGAGEAPSRNALTSRSGHQPLRVGSGSDKEHGRRPSTLTVAHSKPPPPQIWGQDHTVTRTARSFHLEPPTELVASSMPLQRSTAPSLGPAELRSKRVSATAA